MNTRLFVSNLPAGIQYTDLKALFSPFGIVKDVYIPVKKDAAQKAFAFIELGSEKEALAACKAVNKKNYQGKELFVSIAKPKDGVKSRPVQQQRMNNNRQKKNGVTFDPSVFIQKAIDLPEEEVYMPVMKFSGLAVHETLKQNMVAKGYGIPTHIQDKVIPYILQGKDVVGMANTGTGKTAAFAIPMVHKVLEDSQTYCLIITPTRELAAQISTEIYELSRGSFIRAALCIGGANIRNQITLLRRNPQFVIGTPGRLKDLTNTGQLKLNKFNTVILDEVDKMLDMGFIEDITYLTSKLSSKRQSLFFSATIPAKAEHFMKQFLNDPVIISVKVKDSVDHIEQDIVKVTDPAQKLEQLHAVLSGEGVDKVMIFGKTKRGVEKLSVQLKQRGFNAVAIHGDKSQSQRQRALMQFKTDTARILVATDVAARGLDIPNVTHVINYDLPQTYEDYIHRIGRTGRANKKGTALTFVS